MSILKLSYEVAHDIKAGYLTRGDAILEYGHLIDMDTLDEILESLGSVVDNEDGTVTIRVPDSWGEERTGKE